MAAKQGAEERVDGYIRKIKDRPIREMLLISAKGRKYTKDAIVDGSLEELAKRIARLEEAIDGDEAARKAAIADRGKP